MKVYSDDGVIHAVAETIGDTRDLLSYAQKEILRSSMKKVRRGAYRRTCKTCGDKFPTRQGLGLHMWRKHGIHGKRANYSKKWHDAHKKLDGRSKPRLTGEAAKKRNEEMQAMRSNGASVSDISKKFDLHWNYTKRILDRMQPRRHNDLLEDELANAA